MRKGSRRERKKKGTGVESFIFPKRPRGSDRLYYCIDDACGKCRAVQERNEVTDRRDLAGAPTSPICSGSEGLTRTSQLNLR